MSRFKNLPSMKSSIIRFSTFPRTEPPPGFVEKVVSVFSQHKKEVATETNEGRLGSCPNVGHGPSIRCSCNMCSSSRGSRVRDEKIQKPFDQRSIIYDLPVRSNGMRKG